MGSGGISEKTLILGDTEFIKAFNAHIDEDSGDIVGFTVHTTKDKSVTVGDNETKKTETLLGKGRRLVGVAGSYRKSGIDSFYVYSN